MAERKKIFFPVLFSERKIRFVNNSAIIANDGKKLTWPLVRLEGKGKHLSKQNQSQFHWLIEVSSRFEEVYQLRKTAPSSLYNVYENNIGCLFSMYTCFLTAVMQFPPPLLFLSSFSFLKFFSLFHFIQR